jgi:hypothetical protein
MLVSSSLLLHKLLVSSPQKTSSVNYTLSGFTYRESRNEPKYSKQYDRGTRDHLQFLCHMWHLSHSTTSLWTKFRQMAMQYQNSWSYIVQQTSRMVKLYLMVTTNTEAPDNVPTEQMDRLVSEFLKDHGMYSHLWFLMLVSIWSQMSKDV